MESNQIAWLTSLAGLAGALLTQLMTGLFSYVNDRRKQQLDLQKDYRNKRTEIGENFYFMNGELMAMIKKNIAYWHTRLDYRSDAALNFLRQEMDRLDAYQTKLHNENWKYNLIGIYFDTPYDFGEMLEDNKRSHELYLKVLDQSDIIRRTLPQERDDLYPEYQAALKRLCEHYQLIYEKMGTNMKAVKSALVAGFEL
ncbi:hypothetical protein C8P68_1056 [Mucilaginibacter yixingensis]|uniref:Uncharacterized protein n=1 Tax=Mucilaginibacter yixingensis TaxID=1295612 RepID=A0A2T5J7R5_9SPHI|nr:hypothetical protein [Mucilaginibacter yixingensis]PTQ95501.1 hypothetical protein C8P68_1056 [Mucilaginibacter yixingensis]